MEFPYIKASDDTSSLVNEGSAQVVYPKVVLYMNMTMITLAIFTIFYVLGFLVEVCSHLDYFRNDTKRNELLDKMQRFIQEGYPYFLFSILNLLFYGNWRLCTLLTGIIIVLAIIRHFFEKSIRPELIKNMEKVIFCSMIIQFGIFIYTNQDRL